jgi:SAM-dependent methyltransferase
MHGDHAETSAGHIGGTEHDRQEDESQTQMTQNTSLTTQAATQVGPLIAPLIQPDLDIDDEAYAESTTTSYVTSIASEISRGVLENERIYPQYGQHKYGMPVDEEEMRRMDLQHHKYALVLGNKHFLAPIGDYPQEILDLGTGTGIWCLDVADMFPTARVLGVDIAPIQPLWVAPNCSFEIDDIEATWTYKRDRFDFIHLRDPLLVVRDWPQLLHQVLEHLRPGAWFEVCCIHPQPTSDDGSMPPESGFKRMCDKLVEASVLFGASADEPPRYGQLLRSAGFHRVTEHVFKIPSSPWPKDKRLKYIGALEMANVIAGSTAFALRGFEEVFGWSKEQTEVAMIEFRRDVKNKAYHQYCP